MKLIREIIQRKSQKRGSPRGNYFQSSETSANIESPQLPSSWAGSRFIGLISTGGAVTTSKKLKTRSIKA
jgi:hypothetical protein